MSLLVVGSVALDSVKTPFGEATEVLGGSATYFSAAASYFTPVNVVATVGEDFPAPHLEFLRSRGVDVAGVETGRGKTFRWRGEYGYQLNEAKTLDTQLNVFEHFAPRVPDGYRNPSLVFLANIDPVLQRDVLGQVRRPKIVACDTMNFWIESRRPDIVKLLGHVNAIMLNDGEARQLTDHNNLVKAAKWIMSKGPTLVVIKKGEHGAFMFTPKTVFFAPAYPLEEVFDPTGAGDSFAGGFMGYLAAVDDTGAEAMRRAAVAGSVMASFTVEDFGVGRLKSLKAAEINARFNAFVDLTRFHPLGGGQGLPLMARTS